MAPRITPPGPKINMPRNGPAFASEPTGTAISSGPKNPTTNPMIPSKSAVPRQYPKIMANRFEWLRKYSLKRASSVIVGLL